MDPEILNFEHPSPREARQPCSDRSAIAARQDSKRAIIIVACGRNVVADQLLLDKAHIGFGRGIINEHLMSRGVISLVAVHHLSSLLLALDAPLVGSSNRR